MEPLIHAKEGECQSTLVGKRGHNSSVGPPGLLLQGRAACLERSQGAEMGGWEVAKGVRGGPLGHPAYLPVGVMGRELSPPLTQLVFLTLLLASILPFSPTEPRPGTEASNSFSGRKAKKYTQVSYHSVLSFLDLTIEKLKFALKCCCDFGSLIKYLVPSPAPCLCSGNRSYVFSSFFYLLLSHFLSLFRRMITSFGCIW